MFNLRFILASAAIATMTGCAAPAKPLYDWRGYQPQVYEFFKGGSIEQQILALEEQAEKSQAAGTALPPGFRAHLGLLYSKTGNTDKMLEQFAIEEQNFPESKPFFDGIKSRARAGK